MSLFSDIRKAINLPQMPAKPAWALAGGRGADITLTPGSVYTGRVMGRDADGSYTVAVVEPKRDITGAQLAFAVVGGLLGFNVRCKIPVGTRVKLVYGSIPAIFAVIPPAPAAKEQKTRKLLHGDSQDEVAGVFDLFSDAAEDLMDGEFEIANLQGVALQMLSGFARLKAGERAVIEACLLNDMVRVVSQQFSHISGIGEDLIFDHGRPTMERTWSSYRHELFGKLTEQEDYVPMNGDAPDDEALEASRVSLVGRYRFREFFGFAGDFVHSFVTDPPSVVASFADDLANAPAGKSWIHRNSDGTVIIQSVADIRLERVCRIPVAFRKAHHEDPGVTKAREYRNLNQEFLRLSELAHPIDPKDGFRAAYHIRSYARWLSRYHAFARMLQCDQDYVVPTENESPAPSPVNQEADRAAQNAGASYYNTYACIAITRDGSIVIHSGCGAAVVLSNGNVQISAPRHLDLEAGGDIRMLAGGSIHAKARRNIEFVAATGGMILSSYACFKAVCQRGTVWLRSNAPTGKDQENPEAKEEGAPLPEVAGKVSGQKDGCGILLEAADGNLALRSRHTMHLTVDHVATSDTDHTGDLVLQPGGDVRAEARRDVALSGRRVVQAARTALVHAGRRIVQFTSSLFVGRDAGQPMISAENGQVFVDRVKANQVDANALAGPELFGVGVFGGESVPQHTNHINVLNAPVEAPAFAAPELIDLAAEAAVAQPERRWQGAQDGPRIRFSPGSEYAWDRSEPIPGSVPETLTQQYLRLDAADSPLYEAWPVHLFRFDAAPRTDTSSGGFATHEDHVRASDTGEALRSPSASDLRSMSPPPSEWVPKAERFTIRVLRREV